MDKIKKSHSIALFFLLLQIVIISTKERKKENKHKETKQTNKKKKKEKIKERKKERKKEKRKLFIIKITTGTQ